MAPALQITSHIPHHPCPLTGYGVYANRAACCSVNAAFKEGCSNQTLSAKPCWVVDTYYPSRLCRVSNTLCQAGSGSQAYDTKDQCCAANAAFTEGCSVSIPPTPCYTVDAYWPSRTCKLETEMAVCNRGELKNAGSRAWMRVTSARSRERMRVTRFLM